MAGPPPPPHPRAARAPLILLLLSAAAPCASQRLRDYAALRCSACEAVTDELWRRREERVAEPIGDPTIKVSHRLGEGVEGEKEWDHERQLRTVAYEGSEVMAFDVIDGICEKLGAYTLRGGGNKGGVKRWGEGNGAGRYYGRQGKSPKFYGEQDRAAVSGGQLVDTCHELTGEHEEEVERLVREGGGLDKLRDGLCLRASGVCEEAVLAAALKEEQARREEHLATQAEEKRREDAAKERREQAAKEREERAKALREKRANMRQPDPDVRGSYVVGPAGATVRQEEAITSPLMEGCSQLKPGTEVEVAEFVGRRAHVVYYKGCTSFKETQGKEDTAHGWASVRSKDGKQLLIPKAAAQAAAKEGEASREAESGSVEL